MKIKLQKAMVSGLSLVALIAPTITVISCHNNEKEKNTTDIENQPKPDETVPDETVPDSDTPAEDTCVFKTETVDSTENSTAGSSVDQEESVPPSVEIPQIAKNLEAKINKAPYSQQSLFDEAKAIGNDAMWRRGIANEALAQSVSLIDAFAIFSGWDIQKDYLSTKNNYIYIDESNNEASKSTDAVSSLTSQANNIYEFFKTIKPLAKIDPATYRQSTMIFNYKDMGGQDARAGFDFPDKSVINRKYLSGGQMDPCTAQTRTTTYSDYKHPGTRELDIINELTQTAIAKVVKTTTGAEVYKTIPDSQKDNFKPYIELALFKFLKMFADNKMIIASLLVDLPPEQINMFDYILKKYTNPTTHEIDVASDVLDNFWGEINNGSHNLQAIKAMLLGFDDSFNNDTNIFSHLSGLPGLLSESFSAFDITSWAAEGALIQAVSPNSNMNPAGQGIWVFRADKTLDENTKENTGFDTYSEYLAAL